VLELWPICPTGGGGGYYPAGGGGGGHVKVFLAMGDLPYGITSVGPI
jgi:hypothetical protein